MKDIIEEEEELLNEIDEAEEGDSMDGQDEENDNIL